MMCLKSSSLLSCAILLTITADVVHSKYVYHPKSHRKRRQHKEVATWDEAKVRCENEGATLASPISEELLQDMRAIITVNNHTTPHFIGFRMWSNGEFSSEEGISLEDVPEAFDMIEQIDPRHGDCLCLDGHSIRVVPCWSRLPFICYTDETSVDTLEHIPTIKPKPKQDYKQYSMGSYRLHQVNVNWTSAYWACAAEDAYLVVINDWEEAEVIRGILKGYSSWVGIRRLDENLGNWVAITGEPVEELYNEWRDEHANPDHPCAYLRFSDGRLDDWECNDVSHYICEK